MAAAFDRMVDALEAAAAEARASEEATRRILADASHELRTPVAALQATAETLLREQPERPERDAIEASLARDAARLGRLVDDLLGLARLEAGSARGRVSLRALVEAAAEEAPARVPSVRVTVAADGDSTVVGDAGALSRVLRNLLDNAVAVAGEVHVGLARANGTVEARVADDGPRRSGRQARAHLRAIRPAIARRIARQHGGDLTCDPSRRGASFALQLPAA